MRAFYNKWTWGIVSLFLMLSCVSEEKENDFGIGKNAPNSLIRNHLLFSSLEKEFSFPIWFHDSLIAANKIKHITRNIFPQTEEMERLDSGRVVPAETYHYFFRANGSVEKVIHFTYFDHKLIGKSTYRYAQMNGTYGFSAPQLETDFPFDSEINSTEKMAKPSSSRPLSSLIKATKKYALFKNAVSKEQLFVLPDEKYWGPLKIENELHPAPTDKLLIGTAFLPLKKYQVKNTVEESAVQKWTYEKGLIKRIESSEYPFQTNRTFQYDRRGYCISFIDSTFTDGTFLSRTVSRFSNNMLFTPVQIRHKKFNAAGEEAYTFYETFDYEYRK